jgi:hypothetical protein
VGAAASYIKGERLSDAITADNLLWDPSVLALLAFPPVLDMMARDPNWTSQLGYAVLDQKPLARLEGSKGIAILARIDHGAKQPVSD